MTIPERARSKIEGRKLLVELCGHWPSFRDAEVVAIRLERSVSDYACFQTCSVDMLLIGEPRMPTGQRIHLVLEFREVRNVCIAHFQNQNPIRGLLISESVDEEPPTLLVDFQPVHDSGFSIVLHCGGIRLLGASVLS